MNGAYEVLEHHEGEDVTGYRVVDYSYNTVGGLVFKARELHYAKAHADDFCAVMCTGHRMNHRRLVRGIIIAMLTTALVYAGTGMLMRPMPAASATSFDGCGTSQFRPCFVKIVP